MTFVTRKIVKARNSAPNWHASKLTVASSVTKWTASQRNLRRRLTSGAASSRIAGRSKPVLAADLTTAQAARSAAESDRDCLQRELDDVRGQISGLVNFVRAAAASSCCPSSPSRRRRWSRSPSAGGDSSHPRRRARPSSSSPGGTSSASPPHSGSRSLHASSRPPSPRDRSFSAVPPEVESSGRSTSDPDSALSSGSNAAPPADRDDLRDLVDSSENEVLAALASTRSDERRRPRWLLRTSPSRKSIARRIGKPRTPSPSLWFCGKPILALTSTTPRVREAFSSGGPMEVVLAVGTKGDVGGTLGSRHPT
ncbi:unnamed protein product [Phytophthora fragariaefolia]|uniref:Unnamed protein product n=1 Tax=Phytophthora fragariaefolia TaxID=1490495 RepID=A0A9W6XHG3_9STRA|nr:unnamed protein product [Phytophthora fragariaefolia]